MIKVFKIYDNNNKSIYTEAEINQHFRGANIVNINASGGLRYYKNNKNNKGGGWQTLWRGLA